MIGFDVPCSVVRGAVEHFRERMHAGDYLTVQDRMNDTESSSALNVKDIQSVSFKTTP